MVIRAANAGMRIDEIPIELHPRVGVSKLASFRDGWRAFRLMLLYSATYLFLIPGTLAAAIGVCAMATVLADLELFGRPWFIHTLVGGSLLLTAGVQVVGLGLCARAYAVFHMGKSDAWFRRMQSRLRLEHGLLVSLGLFLAGAAIGGVVLAKWIDHGFGSLSEVRFSVVSSTLVLLSIEVFFTSFLLSVLALRAGGTQIDDDQALARVDRYADVRNSEEPARVV